MFSESDQPGREELDQLLDLSEKVKYMWVQNYPDLEHTRHILHRKIHGTIIGVASERIVTPDRRRAMAEGHDHALAAYERWGVFDGEAKPGALMSPREVRDSAPSGQHVLEALETQPELFLKVVQGFTRVLPVPIGLSAVHLKGSMTKALRHYQSTRQLHSTSAVTQQGVAPGDEPVWMHDRYAAADREGKLVYFPQRFTAADHGGMTKAQLLEGMSHAGWQVFLVENYARNSFSEGERIVAGRERPSGRTPLGYLKLLRGDEQYAHECGFTPEAWQSLSLSHLTETDGGVIDMCKCHCLGAYFPSSDEVPTAEWSFQYQRPFIDVGESEYGSDYPRFAVKIL